MSGARPSPKAARHRMMFNAAPPQQDEPDCHNGYRLVYEKLPHTGLRKVQKENTTENKNGART
jgi:hypothetical protein